MNTIDLLTAVSSRDIAPKTTNQIEPDITCLSGLAATTLPQNVGTERRELRVEGQIWWLKKRGSDPDGPFHLEGPMRNGQRCRRGLHHSSVKDAEAEAKTIIKKWNDGWRNPAKVVAPKCSTLGELFAAVQQLDMIADARTRVNYVWGARRWFAFALDRPDVATLPLSVVNGETGEAFFARALAHAAGLATQQEQNKFKRQARGWFNNAKSLFAADSVRSMPQCGLTAPDDAAILAFRKSKPRRFKVAKSDGFVAPDNAVLRETFRQWIKLGRTPGYAVLGGRGNSRRRLELQPLLEVARRNMFLAVGLMLSCALRKGEVRQIRWRHLARDPHGVPRLIARDVKVKKGSGQIEVKPLEPFWRIFNRTIDRHGWRGEPDDYVLSQRPQTEGHSERSPGLEFLHGGHSDRTYWPYHHIGSWLRGLGWNLQKTNHALRDCAASYVTMKFGLDRAKLFCRHEQRATTEANYSRFVREDIMDDPNALRWLTWAKGGGK